MTPALQEKTIKGQSIYLAPTLSSGAVESSETLGMGNPLPVKDMLKNNSVAKITCSVLGLPTCCTNHSTNNFNLEYFDSHSSRDYPLLTSPNLAFGVNNKNHTQTNLEHNCSKMRNPLGNNTNAHFNKMNNLESGVQIRGHTSLGTANNSLRMGRLLDSHVTESNYAEEKQLPNCKWHQTNGLLGKASFVNPEMQKGDLYQVHYDALASTKNCTPSGKEQELNFRLLQCVNKQQVLLSRAKRTQKRLQIMLAKHVVRHCEQQMKCIVRHQIQRMKAFHDPASVLDSNYHGCTTAKNENYNLEANSKDVEHHCGIASGEIKVFARTTAGLLSQMEESLDSEATCSSSSEDDDEQISRNVVAVNYRSDWKWLVDRAKVGCRWTWLQAQISELEYKIQQLTDLHRQIRATKGMVMLEEFSIPKDIMKKRTQLTDHEALLNTTGSSQASLERQDAWPEHDFEMSPSSPTLLLRNIEKQSAQLSEIINSLIAPLNLSPTSSPLSSKSCMQKELVNGISLQDPKNTGEISSSSSWLVDQQHLKRRRKDKTKVKTSPVVVMSTSARTRPLTSFQKRRLYKMSSAFISNQQAMQLRDALFNTDEGIPVSMWHSCEFSRMSGTQKQLMLELDASFHPVLSFPSDTPLHVHFKTLLKKNEVKGDPLETSAIGSECTMSPSTEYCLYRAPAQQWNSGYESSLKHQIVSKLSEQLPDGRKKRHLSETVTGENNNRLETYCFQHEDQEPQAHFAGATIGDMTSKSQLHSRRRLRSESSYDIDNIVIPMSLVAPSKLEKLQYKEILTPSWRMVSLEPLGSLKEDEEKVEDLSDENYAARHAKYEDKERARWSLWEQSQWPRRNRSNSRSSEVQDLAQKEKQVNSDLTTHFSENSADITPEICSSLYLGAPQSSEGTHEARSILWEPRVFPLKDKDTDTLTFQYQITAPQESSNVAILSDSDCTSCAAFRFPNTHQLEEDSQVSLGIGTMRKQT
ncbi:KAT8 regulatory NSL complex subunit 1-like protein isoform X1 [Pogona vitticeps]